MILRISIFTLSILLLAFSSCVSNQKYLELEEIKDRYKDQAAQVDECETDKEQISEELRKTEALLKQSILEREEMTIRVNRLSQDFSELNNRYDLLLSQNEALIDVTAYEKKVLQEEIGARNFQLDNQVREYSNVESQFFDRQEDLNELRRNLDERENQLAELEQVILYREQQMLELNNNIIDAVRGYTASELSVNEKEGKLYVSLSQELLFKSGSTKIDKKGRKAIIELAGVLIQNPNVEITIEGHTDSDGSESQNWKLSTERALSVLRLLRDNGVDPTRITAAGRAYFDPIRPNDSEANKALNRRTEIILSPNLDQLYDIIEK
jgi:chemotaxis protein MotB